MISWTVLAVVLLIIAKVEAKGDVTVWRDKVTLTCPEDGHWFDGSGKKISDDNERTFKFTFSIAKEHYRCEYNSENSEKKIIYYFYFHGKACKNCFELNALTFAVVIVADVIVTGIVMIMVYKCTKKKTAEPQHVPKAGRPRQEDIPLHAHNSPYAPLSHHTRNNDPYSQIHPTINKTG